MHKTCHDCATSSCIAVCLNGYDKHFTPKWGTKETQIFWLFTVTLSYVTPLDEQFGDYSWLIKMCSVMMAQDQTQELAYFDFGKFTTCPY